MYSTYNEGKSVVAERFIRTLKDMVFKHMAAISENVYFDVLDDILNKYNNKTQIKEILNLKLVIMLEFQKGYTPNLSEDVFFINEIKNKVPWTYVINDLNGEEITGSFYEK